MQKTLSARKQVLAIFTIFLFVLTIFTALMALTFSKLFLDKHITYSQTQSQQYSKEIEHIYTILNNSVSFLIKDDNIKNIFSQSFSENTVDYLSATSQQISDLMSLNLKIEDIALVNDNIHWSAVYNYQSLNEIRLKMVGKSGLVSMGVSDNNITKNYDPQSHMVFGSNVYLNGINHNIGTLIISLTGEDIFSLHTNQIPNEYKESTYFFLSSSDLQMTPYHHKTEEVVDIADGFKKIYNQESLPPHGSYKLETAQYIYQYSSIPQTDFYIISVIDKYSIRRDLYGIAIYIVGLVFVLFLILFVLFNFLIKNIVDPLHILHQRMYQIRKRNQPSEILILSGCKEISQISTEFNTMISELTMLNNQLIDTISKLYETDLGKKEAEIAYLRSQINPHFLYNTLESMRGIAVENNVPQLAAMASAMGKMFRYSIKGDSIVPLWQEIEIIQAYVNIQHSRFNNRFEVVYNIPPEIKDIAIIKMLLQPIVENAIIHGLEKEVEGGILYIGGKLKGDKLILSVIDNGKGMTKEQLELLQDALEKNVISKEFIGISNTQNRIFLTYGQGNDLKIQSSFNGGTQVDIILPNPVPL